MSELREEIRAAFRWVDGHADLWQVWANGGLLRRLGPALAEPFADSRIATVLAIESRGFILGPLVAAHLGAGFVAIRKECGLLPGPLIRGTTAPDYRGNRSTLRLQSERIDAGDRVLLVDDWAETGSQLRTVAAMVGERGAEVVGTALLVNELGGANPPELGRLHALVTADELG